MDGLDGAVTLAIVSDIPVIRLLRDMTADEGMTTQLADAAQEALGHGGTRIILDLSAISYVASPTVGLMAQIHALLAERGGGLVVILRPDDESIRRILKVTRLATVVEIQHDLTRTLSRLSGR